MLPREAIVIVEDLQRSAHSGNDTPISSLVMEFGNAVFGEISPEVFVGLAGLLGDANFLGLLSSWKLAHMISQNWEFLSAEQRLILRKPFSDAFDKYGDPMGAFVVGEILGGCYGDREALDVLERMARSARMPARAFVPHGIETLARKNDISEGLRALAVRQLRELARDSDDDVRREALLSLKKVSREFDIGKDGHA